MRSRPEPGAGTRQPGISAVHTPLHLSVETLKKKAQIHIQSTKYVRNINIFEVSDSMQPPPLSLSTCSPGIHLLLLEGSAHPNMLHLQSDILRPD